MPLAPVGGMGEVGLRHALVYGGVRDAVIMLIDFDVVVERDHPSLNTTADGSLYFSILDLAKWDAALYTEKLLKKSSLAQMWTVLTNMAEAKPDRIAHGVASLYFQNGNAP